MALRVFLCVGFLSLCFWSSDAVAHVKWFVEYNLLCPPRSPIEIVSGEYFLLSCVLVGPVMFAVAYADRHPVCRQSWLAQHASTLTDRAQPYFPTTLRLGVSAFFTAAAAYGGFLLTPELKTEDGWVFAAHVAIAGFALLPRTAFLAGFGMIALYVHAIDDFGLYHLLDYPIFLGVAVYMILVSYFGEEQAMVAQNVMRWCTGITLMWAGIEKFAFPEWSFGLLAEQPDLTFGLDAELYMVAAGFVEFCCAYLLITGMLSARAAALVLLFFFVSAIYYFGLIDAIGHSVIIVVLILLALGQNRIGSRLQSRTPVQIAAVHTGLFFGSLFLFIGLYCGGHYLSYQPYMTPSECALQLHS